MIQEPSAPQMPSLLRGCLEPVGSPGCTYRAVCVVDGWDWSRELSVVQ